MNFPIPLPLPTKFYPLSPPILIKKWGKINDFPPLYPPFLPWFPSPPSSHNYGEGGKWGKLHEFSPLPLANGGGVPSSPMRM